MALLPFHLAFTATDELIWRGLISALMFLAVFIGVYYGAVAARRYLAKLEAWYDRVLVQQLLLEIEPRTAVYMSGMAMCVTGLIGYAAMLHWSWFVGGAALGAFIPNVVVRHLEQKRREKLEEQLVDGITTMASGMRAGLNIVQAFELLVKNSAAPISQEFGQLLREYQMGLDLPQAMRKSADRIGSQHFRLLFSAIEMHRQRGGDAAESLDRINESIREIQRLEGKLDALTAQGRYQAWMMAATPPVLLLMFYLMVDDQAVIMLFTDYRGRILLLVAALMTVGAFFWIRRIMQIDI